MGSRTQIRQFCLTIRCQGKRQSRVNPTYLKSVRYPHISGKLNSRDGGLDFSGFGVNAAVSHAFNASPNLSILSPQLSPRIRYEADLGISSRQVPPLRPQLTSEQTRTLWRWDVALRLHGRAGGLQAR